MRIVLLNHNLLERGTYFRARETARLLAARGHDVTFVTTGHGYWRSQEARRGRLRTVATANWSPIKGPDDGLSPIGLLQRAALLRGRFELVYTFSHKPVDVWIARMLRRRGGFWLADWCDLWNADGGVYDYRNWARPLPTAYRDWRAPIYRAVDRWEQQEEARVPREADAVTIIASWMRTRTQALRVPDERVYRYVSGADTARVHREDKRRCRAALGIEDTGGPILGYVANYTIDNEQLEAALGIVWREIPNMRLLLAGHHFYTAEGPVGAAERRGLVLNKGRVPFRDITKLLGAADVLTIPMRDTNFNRSRWPHKFGDYLAAGRPIATTRVGDIPEQIEAHRLGAVGAPTAEGLAAAIVELLRSPEEWEPMGARGRALAIGPAGWPARFEGLRRFLERHRIEL